MAALFGKKKKKGKGSAAKKAPAMPKRRVGAARKAPTKTGTKAKTSRPRAPARPAASARPRRAKAPSAKGSAKKTAANPARRTAKRKGGASGGSSQNGLFVRADGKIFLFHRTLGWKPLAKKHLDAAIESAFGSK